MLPILPTLQTLLLSRDCNENLRGIIILQSQFKKSQRDEHITHSPSIKNRRQKSKTNSTKTAENLISISLVMAKSEKKNKNIKKIPKKVCSILPRKLRRPARAEEKRGWWLLVQNRDCFMCLIAFDKNRESTQRKKKQKSKIMEPIMFMLGSLLCLGKGNDETGFRGAGKTMQNKKQRREKKDCNSEHYAIEWSRKPLKILQQLIAHDQREFQFQFREWLLIYYSCRMLTN